LLEHHRPGDQGVGEEEAAMTEEASAENAGAACPICGGREFIPGPKGRMAPNGRLPRCAGCGSLERHRMFRRMFERLGPAAFAAWRAIQFSPDPTVERGWFASFELSVFDAPGGLDVQAIARPSGVYDYVGCSHVLEHVPDDRAALSELLRIAAPDGLVFLVVPDPFREARTREWGFAKPEKHGHFRVYGADIAGRFERYAPRQPVIAYVGEDPVTGERDGCFLLPRSAARRRWLVDRLGAAARLFCGPGEES
jgi:SAM-dependent methyltransferase